MGTLLGEDGGPYYSCSNIDCRWPWSRSEGHPFGTAPSPQSESVRWSLQWGGSGSASSVAESWFDHSII